MNSKDNKIYVALFMSSILEMGGGLEKYFIQIASELSSRGVVQCDIVTLDDLTSIRICKALQFITGRGRFDINLMYREPLEKIKLNLGSARYIKCKDMIMLKKVLQGYDLVYSKNEFLEAGILKFLIGYRELGPIVYGVHTPHRYPVANSFLAKLHNLLYCSMLYNFFLSGTQFIHVNNSQSQIDIQKQLPDHTTKLIYYPFDINKYRLQKKGANHSASVSTIKIIWLGRITEQKGIDDLIYIIEKINASIASKVSWTIAGNGDQKVKIEELARKHPNVNYLGHIANDKVPTLFSSMDLMISTSHWEVSPFNILEAQACNLPVVAYNIPGPADIIDVGNTGWLAETRTDFVSRLESIINNGKVASTKSPRRNIELKFNPDLIYGQITSFFKLVSNSRTKSS
jgi:glycosyltransferase involved in cell wall biosynthesis